MFFFSCPAVNGERHWLPCDNQQEDQIVKWIELLRTQNEDSGSERLRKLWYTNKPSIQGAWTPYTHRNPELNLAVFPNEKFSRPLDIEESATEKLIELFKKQKLEEEGLGEKRGE